ncbi:MAG: efflux RND transporter periplasmic adaptor subunit [Chryseolinea sp.]
MQFLIRIHWIVVGFVALTSCGGKKGPDPAPRRQQGPLVVDGFIVREQSISEKIEVPGSLLPFEETQIRAEVGGRVVELNVREGESVKKGTTMVKLFDRDLQAQLKKFRVQLQIREKSQERSSELLEIQGISQQDYDLSALDVENLRADIEATQIAISKTEIRAPYDGQVGLRNISLGSFISPTDIITTLRQVDNLKLEFSVPEKYAKEIMKGYRVSFRVDGGDVDHSATVIATENSVDQNTRTLRVRARVNANHAELVPGVFAKVNLQLGKDERALLIPSQAIIPAARNKQVILFKSDSAVYTVVETGIRDSAFVQVVNGLKVGDTIITTGLMAIRPNAKIKLNRLAPQR